MNIVKAMSNTYRASRHRHAARAIWWDRRPNFGDEFTESILNLFGAEHVINVRDVRFDVGPALLGAGSMLQKLRYPNTVVWGSGFIDRDLVNSSLRSPNECLALRGHLSRSVAEKAGWPVSDNFGDPGIFATQIINKPKRPNCEITVVPHFRHFSFFSSIVNSSAHIQVVDAQSGLINVLRQIAGSEIVLSSSLHGIVVAHAYGIPWTWLRFTSHRLGGDQFKFHDFFSGMGIDASPFNIKHPPVDAAIVDNAKDAARLPASRSIDEVQQTLTDSLLNSSYASQFLNFASQ